MLCVTLPDPKRELIVLIDLQLAVLEKEVFGVVTDAERREYWRRHDRIRKLYSQLNEMPGLESVSERFNVEPMPRQRKKTRVA